MRCYVTGNSPNNGLAVLFFNFLNVKTPLTHKSEKFLIAFQVHCYQQTITLNSHYFQWWLFLNVCLSYPTVGYTIQKCVKGGGGAIVKVTRTGFLLTCVKYF